MKKKPPMKKSSSKSSPKSMPKSKGEHAKAAVGKEKSFKGNKMPKGMMEGGY